MAKVRCIKADSGDEAESDFVVCILGAIMTEIRRTECITFPRSGHHLLHALLSGYFSEEEFVYCEMYHTPDKVLDRDPMTNFQKNHDLQFMTPIKDDRQYLVQVRYPIDAIISWYKFSCESGQEDSPGAWKNYAIEVSAQWMCFYKKWVLDYVPNRFVLNYGDLMNRPVDMLAGVVRFLGDENPDMSRIEESCRSQAIRQRNTYKEFKYFGPHFFSIFKGLFAAVPGIDLINDALTIPDDCRSEVETFCGCRSLVEA